MRRRPRRRPHPQLHLPPLEGNEALLFVAICERLIAAVWRAHGDTMGHILLETVTNRLVNPPALTGTSARYDASAEIIRTG
jgi:hypothetical protein